MAVNRQRLEEGITDDCGSESNTSSTDELAAISALTRGTGEMMIIQTLQRFVGPIFVPIFRPLIRQFVKEEFELPRQQELLTSKKRNPASVVKKLKLQFRNRISLPVFTGIPLLGENKTPIEIALIDALTDQIVNTGTESTLKLEIVGFQVGDDDGDSWTIEEFQTRILSERNVRRILQGNTSLQLKEGIGFVGEISFTHKSEHTKNGLYRLGAIVVDAALMNVVEVAWTEKFTLKDKRYTYSEKHPHPSLSDKVCHLQKISYRGTRYKDLKNKGVITVKDLLILLYTDQKQLERILKLKASSNIWDCIISNAQASNGIFLCLNSSNTLKTGVVLDVKLQLKGLIVEPHQYIPVNQLSDKQKVDNQNLVRFASEHLKELHSFEDETSLKEYLQMGASESLGTTKVADAPPNNLNSSDFHMGQSPNHAPMETTQSEKGKEKVSFDDDDMIYSTNYYQEHMSFHLPNLETPNGLNHTDPVTSSQAVESHLNTCELMNTLDIVNPSPEDLEELQRLLSNELHYTPANSDTNVVMLAAQAVSVCTIAQTRWTKVSKLLRRNSVRERISLSEGIQVLKRHRWC